MKKSTREKIETAGETTISRSRRLADRGGTLSDERTSMLGKEYPFLRRLSDPKHFQWKEIKKKITSWWVAVAERGSTPLKFNMLRNEKLTNPKRKDRFTTINFFKGYLKLQGGTILNQHEPKGPQVNRQHKPTTKTSRTIFVRQQDTWVLRVSS